MPLAQLAQSTADRLEWAPRLGRAADALAIADPLPVPAGVAETLRAIYPPGAAEPSLVFPDRLVEVAVIASEKAAATSRLEIYQRGLDPARAVRLAAGALYGAAAITAEEIARRGRSWVVRHIDWRAKRVTVEPSDVVGSTRWISGGRAVSHALARAHHDVLAGARSRM